MKLICAPAQARRARVAFRTSRGLLSRQGAGVRCGGQPSQVVGCFGMGCLYRKLDSAIMMMKSAEDRHRCDAAYVLDGAIDRSVFAKRPMRPQLIIISGILRQNPA